jgi:acetoin utilization protein AcuC
VVPRSWTHLLATVLDRDVDPRSPLPAGWVTSASRLTSLRLRTEMTDGADVAHAPWLSGTDRVEVAILETRRGGVPAARP